MLHPSCKSNAFIVIANDGSIPWFPKLTDFVLVYFG